MAPKCFFFFFFLVFFSFFFFFLPLPPMPCVVVYFSGRTGSRSRSSRPFNRVAFYELECRRMWQQQPVHMSFSSCFLLHLRLQRTNETTTMSQRTLTMTDSKQQPKRKSCAFVCAALSSSSSSKPVVVFSRVSLCVSCVEKEEEEEEKFADGRSEH